MTNSCLSRPSWEPDSCSSFRSLSAPDIMRERDSLSSLSLTQTRVIPSV